MKSCNTRKVAEPGPDTTPPSGPWITGIRLAALLAATALITSCSTYEIQAAQNDELPCYSTWNWHPHNA